MGAFDQVIGYEPIKEEMLQVCDMIRNPEIYRRMGAILPRGMMLYGDPGLGKTLMAKAFIQEAGLPAITVRKSKGKDDVLERIEKAFKDALKQAPSIVFLDDMDKFANEDRNRCDTDEYVAIQAGIDDVKDKNVFVLATANDYDKLPPPWCDADDLTARLNSTLRMLQMLRKSRGIIYWERMWIHPSIWRICQKCWIMTPALYWKPC